MFYQQLNIPTLRNQPLHSLLVSGVTHILTVHLMERGREGERERGGRGREGGREGRGKSVEIDWLVGMMNKTHDVYCTCMYMYIHMYVYFSLHV